VASTFTVSKNDFGFVIEREIVNQSHDAIDISSAGTLPSANALCQFELPDGTTTSKNAAYTNTGTDGRLQYTMATGVLTVAGTWKFQFKVILSSAQFHTLEEEFTVADTLV